MIRLEEIKSACPSLDTLRTYQAMRTFRRTKELTQSYPVLSLFLAIFIVLGLLPVIVFAALVSSPFLVVSVSALTVFGGTFLVAFFSLMVILFPLLMFGVAGAIFFFLAYRLAVNTLRKIKQLRDMIFSFPSRILQEYIRFGSKQEKLQHALTPQSEEMIGWDSSSGLKGIKGRNCSLNKLKLD